MQKALSVMLLFAFACVALGIDPVAAQQGADAIGHVSRLKGQVSVMRDGERQTLNAGDQIYAEDVLKTGLVGRVEVQFTDDSSVTLADRTTFSIDDYGLSEPDEHMNMHLVIGAVRAVSGKIAQKKPKAYKLTTPVATIGIRGTDIWAGTLDGLFNVVLLSGTAVVVENPRGRVELTQPGQSTQISVPGITPPDPDAPQEEMANILGQMAREALAPGHPSPLAADRLSAVLESVAF